MLNILVALRVWGPAWQGKKIAGPLRQSGRGRYSPLKQLARADIIFGPPGLHLVLKWSKNAVRIIKLPQLPLSPLCPVNATRKMLKLAPGTADSPLFQIKSKSQWLPLTDSQLRKHQKGIMLKLNMSQAGITFHSFRW